MSIEERLGQRFIAFVPRRAADAPATPDELRRLLRPVSPAGFILYRWNLDSYAGTARLTKQLQALQHESGAETQLLFAVDQEGGRVANMRFPQQAAFPSAFQLGARGDARYVSSAAYITGVDLARVGILMNFAPVLDLYGTEDTSIFGDRSFGDVPERVAALGASYIRGAMDAGIVPVAKHFPGHGVTTVDSHGTLPVSDIEPAALRSGELEPYRAAIEAGVPAIMTAHILYPKIDPDYPATLSPRFIDGILRRELGFEGVVITDGFSMGALSGEYSRPEALRQSFLAGVDLILIHARYDYAEVFAEAAALIEQGIVSTRRLTEGARRVLLLKGRLGLL
jgi:beta-N-acetylhexosaminidase